MSERADMVVYLIRSGESDAFKIGYARNVAQRISELQCGSPDLLTLVASTFGAAKLEGRMHRMFQQHRIRGEWFRFDEAQLVIVRGVFARTVEVESRRWDDAKSGRNRTLCRCSVCGRNVQAHDDFVEGRRRGHKIVTARHARC